jgi:hypothetical protein
MREMTTKVDPVKNRITIFFDGFMSLEEAKILQENYRKAIQQCRPGFTVLTHAIDYKPGTPEVQDIVVSMTKMAGDAGCSKVARVVGDKPLGAMQIDRLAKSVTSYPSCHFQTVEEAEAYLDSDA